jgi:hypothetical protein
MFLPKFVLVSFSTMSIVGASSLSYLKASENALVNDYNSPKISQTAQE